MGNAIIPFISGGSTGSIFTTYKEFDKTFTGTHTYNTKFQYHDIEMTPWLSSESASSNRLSQISLLDSTDETRELNRRFLFPIILIESCHVTTTAAVVPYIMVTRPSLSPSTNWLSEYVAESLESGTTFSFSPTWSVAIPQTPVGYYYDQNYKPLRVRLPCSATSDFSFSCDIVGSIVGIEVMPE